MISTSGLYRLLQYSGNAHGNNTLYIICLLTFQTHADFISHLYSTYIVSYASAKMNWKFVEGSLLELYDVLQLSILYSKCLAHVAT